ncbi:hypothetical protein F3Y22_tig00110303pilonHSYRG00288 [Hibiscus syriacus]|uniref:WRC domain-containing protein n=1 Tax=Hibiscus syriacus TaxID=106335 RepID=A0A6A3B3H5_HIBSY|nr:uncharacterized protein LOC120116717 [Hibiscus syriacus]KAE8711131.1 hypothetical protein F3Y22_tig00110303pilonHSYRG00288 [Hibiscus syriacus]
MRIRKRAVQQPFSSLSPLSSDPNINRSPVVQHPPRRQSPPPSDHPNYPIRRKQPTQDRASYIFPETTTIKARHGKELKKKEDDLVLKQGVEEEKGENGEEKSNYTTRKKSILGEGLGTESLFHQGDKAFPLKKRGRPERRMQKDNDNYNDNDNKSGKKRGRSGALMEGSRCSRVNGRGWRCCQQTLVGYSLCEHHLGKGRLRSITSVKSRSNDNNAAKKEDLKPPLSKQGSDEKPLMKLGMVKARSMSCLLGQNDDGTAVHDRYN